MKYRKKPVVIDAVQWFKAGDHPDVTSPKAPSGTIIPTAVGFIKTLEGWMSVNPGDWIITGVKGEHYPCKPDIFAATYEVVDHPYDTISELPAAAQPAVKSDCSEQLAEVTKKLRKAESQRDNFSKRLAASEQRIKDVENESAALRAYRDTLQTELAAVREELKMCREKALEEAARTCDAEISPWRDLAKMEIRYGFNKGCATCADKIRQLKEPKE